MYKLSTFRTSIGFALIALLLSSCFEGDGKLLVSKSLRVKRADGVKLLVQGNDVAHDSSLFEQSDYIVGPGQNLLVRWEEMIHEAIDYNNEQKIIVTINFNSEEERDAARSTALLCPADTSWMMLATWYRTHPFSPDAKWNSEGGDFTESLCLRPIENIDEFLNGNNESNDESNDESEDEENEDDKPSYSINGHLLAYDIKDWYADEVLSNRQNHGFILISDTDIQILGNGTHRGPRFFWLDFAYDEGYSWTAGE